MSDQSPLASAMLSAAERRARLAALRAEMARLGQSGDDRMRRMQIGAEVRELINSGDRKESR